MLGLKISYGKSQVTWIGSQTKSKMCYCQIIIAVIKSLPISKINFLFRTLTNPLGDFLKELNIILLKFLWSNKEDRIFFLTCMSSCQ